MHLHSQQPEMNVEVEDTPKLRQDQVAPRVYMFSIYFFDDLKSLDFSQAETFNVESGD